MNEKQIKLHDVLSNLHKAEDNLYVIYNLDLDDFEEKELDIILKSAEDLEKIQNSLKEIVDKK